MRQTKFRASLAVAAAALASNVMANTAPNCMFTTDKVYADGSPIRSGAFTGSLLYLLGAPKQGRLALYKLQTEAERAGQLEPILSMGGNAGQPLLLHGPEGGAAKALTTLSTLCPRAEGNQRLIISLDRSRANDAAAQKNRGSWTVIPGFPTPVVLDLQKMEVVETDSDTLQTRAALKIGSAGAMFTKGETPLFYDNVERRIYTWKEGVPAKDAQSRGVTRWRISPGAKKDGGFVAEAKFVLGAEERVAFSAGATQTKMAAVSFDAATNEVIVREAPGWSGESAGAAHYKFALPKSYAAKDSAVSLAIERSLAVVTPLAPMAKQRWQRIFIYNYKTGKQIRAVTIEPGLQAGAPVMHAGGALAAVDLTKSGSFVGAMVIDLEHGESHIVTASGMAKPSGSPKASGKPTKAVKPSPSASLKGA